MSHALCWLIKAFLCPNLEQQTVQPIFVWRTWIYLYTALRVRYDKTLGLSLLLSRGRYLKCNMDLPSVLYWIHQSHMFLSYNMVCLYRPGFWLKDGDIITLNIFVYIVIWMVYTCFQPDILNLCNRKTDSVYLLYCVHGDSGVEWLCLSV